MEKKRKLTNNVGAPVPDKHGNLVLRKLVDDGTVTLPDGAAEWGSHIRYLPEERGS